MAPNSCIFCGCTFTSPPERCVLKLETATATIITLQVQVKGSQALNDFETKVKYDIFKQNNSLDTCVFVRPRPVFPRY